MRQCYFYVCLEQALAYLSTPQFLRGGGASQSPVTESQDTWQNHAVRVSGGRSSSSPTQISTPEQLAGINSGGYYILTANIDLGAYDWVPIYAGDGKSIFFNGNGYVISNMHISQESGTDGVGLFSRIDIGSTISHLFISNATVVMNSYGDGVGILAGLISGDCTFSNCGALNSSIIISESDELCVGGLIGGISDATSSEIDMEQCFAEDVTIDIQAKPGSYYVGGLIGSFVGDMIYCYSKFSLESTIYPSAFGGLVGIGDNPESPTGVDYVYISFSYTYFNVTPFSSDFNASNSILGGIIGLCPNYVGSCDYCFVMEATRFIYHETSYNYDRGYEGLLIGSPGIENQSIYYHDVDLNSLDLQRSTPPPSDFLQYYCSTGYQPGRGTPFLVTSSYDRLPQLTSSLIYYNVSATPSATVRVLYQQDGQTIDYYFRQSLKELSGYLPVRGRQVRISVSFTTPTVVTSFALSDGSNWTYDLTSSIQQTSNQFYYVDTFVPGTAMYSGSSYQTLSVKPFYITVVGTEQITNIKFVWQENHTSTVSSNVVVSAGSSSATLSSVGNSHSFSSKEFSDSSVTFTVKFGNLGTVGMTVTTSSSSVSAGANAKAGNERTYSWSKANDVTVYIFTYQLYTIYFDPSGGNEAPFTRAKFHDVDLQLPNNTYTMDGYEADGWILAGTSRHYANGEYYSGNEDEVMFQANWKIKMMTFSVTFYVYKKDGSGDYFKELLYATMTYRDKDVSKSLAVSHYGDSATWEADSVNSGMFEVTLEDNYVIVRADNVYLMSSSGNTYSYLFYNGITDYSFATDIYVYEVSDNRLKYDSLEQYWYFEDGEYPQKEVTDSATLSVLNSMPSSTQPTYTLQYHNGKEEVPIHVYTYSEKKYAQVEVNGVSKWFEVQPIRWRVSDYGVSSSAPSTWGSYGVTRATMGVSVNILFASVMTPEKISDDKETNSADFWLNNYIYETDMENFNVKHASYFSHGYDGFVSAGGQDIVTEFVGTSTSGAVYSGVDDSFREKRAKLTDFASFLMYGTTAYANTYDTYWTRDLKSSDGREEYGCGVVVTSDGQQTLRWLNQMCGVRLTYSCREVSYY